MDAIIKAKKGPGLELVNNIQVPKPGVNDILVKINKTSICGTDVHIDKWDDWAQKTVKPPLVIGHEWVGTVVEVGDNVIGYKEGDRISGEGHLVCGKCRHCLSGNKHLCPKTQGIGYNCPGAFAEYFSFPSENAWHVDPEISDEIMACFDPLGNAVHSCFEFDLTLKNVLITGAGPLGCMCTAIAKHVGALNVVVTDINPYRLELGRKMGATAVIDERSESLEETMNKLGIQGGFDVGLEMSGAPQAFAKMLDSLDNGANVSLLGILPDGAPADWTKIIFKSINIKGIYGRKIFDTWFKATDLIKAGLDITPIITHKFHYTDFQKGFDLMKSGESGKVILEWS